MYSFEILVDGVCPHAPLIISRTDIPVCPGRLKESVLLQQHHLFRFDIIAGAEFVEIYSRYKLIRLPDSTMITRRLIRADQRLHLAAKDVVNIDRGIGLAGESVAYCCRGVERVGVIIQ